MPFLIFHGEDSFSQDEAVAALKAQFSDPTTADLNMSTFDGRAALTVSDLRGACDAFPFLASQRVVLVDGLLTRLLGNDDEGGESTPTKSRGRAAQKELLEALAAYLPNLPDFTQLVFVERRELPAKHALLKLADGKLGTARVFMPPAPDALPGWITQRAKHQRGAFSAPAAALLAQYIGADLRALDHEIAKLITYVNAARPVTPEDVQLLVPASSQANIFEMVDALGRRDSKQAARLLHRLLDLGEHPLGLLAMIVRQFRLLIQAKELTDAGQRGSEVSRRLGIPSFVAEKLARQTKQFTLPQLELIYHKLLETDVAIKSGTTEADVALDLFVAGLG